MYTVNILQGQTATVFATVPTLAEAHRLAKELTSQSPVRVTITERD